MLFFHPNPCRNKVFGRSKCIWGKSMLAFCTQGPVGCVVSRSLQCSQKPGASGSSFQSHHRDGSFARRSVRLCRERPMDPAAHRMERCTKALTNGAGEEGRVERPPLRSSPTPVARKVVSESLVGIHPHGTEGTSSGDQHADLNNTTFRPKATINTC